MKRNWIRKVAIILSLTLILNSGFSDLAGYAYAATVTSAQNTSNHSTENSITDEQTTESLLVNNNEEAATAVVVENVSENETDSAIEDSVPETTTEAVTVEDTTNETVTETVDTTEASTQTATTEEVTTEAETTEEATTEVIEESETLKKTGVSLFATGDIEVSVPADVDEFLAKAAASDPVNTISVYTWQDMINIQNLCKDATSYEKVKGFKDITFLIQIPKDVPSGQQYWDSTQAEADGFVGIGTSNCPFKGTMKGAFPYTSGTTYLELDRPLFRYLATGATFSNMKIVAKGCCSPIAENISGGTINLSDLAISGTIGTKEDGTRTSQGGTFAGYIWGQTTLSVSNVRSTANIKATEAGALAGRCYGQLSIEGLDGYIIGDNGTPITVYGTFAAGGLFGIVAGTHSIDLRVFNYVSVKVVGNGGTSYTGYLFGIATGKDRVTDITLTGSNTITVNIGTETSGTCAGGLIGWVNTDVALSLPEDGFTIYGTIDGGGQLAGGVIGKAENSTIEITPVTIAATTTISGYKVGGILGHINNCKMIIDTPTVNGTLTSTGTCGGILGIVQGSSAVELQGTVTLLNKLTGTTKGSVVGSNGESDGKSTSLVYLAGVEGKVNGVDQLVVPKVSEDVHTTHNDYGDYGGVFRNQQLANGKLLIGDTTNPLENVGVINNTITKSGDWYQLGTDGKMDATADLETFAIVHYTEGQYGLTAFDGASSCGDLLKASYQLNANADISYFTTGIDSLNRRNIISKEAYAFSGKLCGVDKNITITQYNYNRFRSNNGIFGTLSGDAEFTNLVIDGKIKGSSYVGGIAYNTIGTSLTLTDIHMKKTYVEIYKGVGGVLVHESGSSRFTLNAENVTLESKITTGSDTPDFSGFITTMSDAEINLKNIKLGGSLKSTGVTVSKDSNKDSLGVGGFLGRTWQKTGGVIDGITVLSEGATYTTDIQFGGLVHTITNQSDSDASRLTMKDVDLARLSVTMSGQADCALLVQNGKRLILETIDYSAAGANVSNADADFDEFVATTNIRNVDTFGIISIHNTEELFDGATGYHYENQATYEGIVPTGNEDTRYYYDVFQHLENEDGTPKEKIGKPDGYYEIDSAWKYFLVDIVQCSDKSSYNVSTYFTKFFTDGDTPGNAEKYYLKGTLDLEPYSVYPMPRQSSTVFQGQDDARLIFAAAGMEDWTIPNVDKDRVYYQHYRLHCALMCSTYSGNLKIDNITFKGTIGPLSSYYSGVLVSGDLSAGAEISNITLDGLYISSYGEDSSKNSASLLIGHISDAAEDEVKTVTFDNIKMTGYEKNPYTEHDAKRVAASLIYTVGDEDARGIDIKFTNMVIEDDLEAEDAKYGNFLKYSSFIYRYNYTDDASLNEGSGLYLFTEADEAAGRVTYGAELDYDTEYYDTVNKVLDESNDILMNMLGKIPADAATVWIPYVYDKKKIEVNPKSADILKGCGTYEDPYIIESAKQFLTLYRYVNEIELDEENTEYQYQTFYAGWKIIKTGTDATDDFCATKHIAALATDAAASGDITRTVTVDGITYSFTGTGGEDARVFGEEEFPTPDQLSQAYYQLGEDIDLSGITKGTYAQIAQDFSGFGTYKRPFTGVWYGRDSEDSTKIHTITLPDKMDDTTYAAYGFIQYAKGAVVKDLNLTTATTFPDGYDRVMIDNGRAAVGGSVFAYILGGDNVIDNVTTSVQVYTTNHSIIGGYVGIVKKGGLILRNMTDASIENFRIIYSWAGGGHIYSSIVGKVEDGFVVYDGDSDNFIADSSDDYILKPKEYKMVKAYWEGDESLQAIPAIANYSIVNGSKLKTDASQNGGIQVTVTDGATNAEKEVLIELPNTAALQVMAMAMNADALNVRPANYMLYRDNDMHWGYAEDSRSRKASYNTIGCNVQTSDYLSAVKYDNMMGYSSDGYSAEKAFAYPYLYDYMGLTEGDYLTVMNGSYSVLNLSEAANTIIYRPVWELAESSTYDLTVYEEAFKGIGALYYENGHDAFVSNFHGDLDGKNSTVIYDITRRLYWDYDKYAQPGPSQHYAGLFNTLVAPAMNSTTQSVYRTQYDFAGLDGVSKPRYAHTIQNIKVKGDVDVVADGFATTVSISNAYVDFGGIAGRIYTGNHAFINVSTPEDDPMQAQNTYARYLGGIVGAINNYAIVLIQDCQFKGTESQKVELKGASHTGGFVGYDSTLRLKIVDSSIEYTEVYSNSGYAGGMVGYGNTDNVYDSTLMLFGTQEDDVYAKNTAVRGWDLAGGIIGQSGKHVQTQNVLSESNTVEAYNHIGGVVGYLTGAKESELYDINVKDIVTYEMDAYNGQHTGIGGVIGKNEHTLLLEGANVTGTKNGDTYNCRIQGIEKNRTGACGVGGIVGYTRSKPMTLRDCTVSNIYVKVDGKLYTIDTTVYAPALMAGGLVGFVEAELRLDGTLSTSGLTVAAPQQTELGLTNYDLVGAGGCFGRIKYCYAGGYRTDSSLVYYQGLSVQNNTIRGKNSGGICGYVDNANIRLQGVKVNGGDIYGDSTAGGIFGYAIPGTEGSAINGVQTYLSTTEEDQNLVLGVSITGTYAGGAIGHANVINRLRIENITILDCDIHARQQVGHSRNSAGGLMGAVSISNGKEAVVYGVTIDGNTIVCENEGTTIAKGKIVYPAAGGLVGRSMENSKSGSFFCDLMTITENNQIGFIDSTADETSVKLATYNETDSVYELVDPKLPENIAVDDTEEPKMYQAIDELVTQYGWCVGSVIGVADSNMTQFYIWRSLDENNLFENPVMSTNPPITDVGFNETDENTLTSGKYWRNQVHIVYGAPVTEVTDTVDNESVTYQSSDPTGNLAYMKMRVEEANEIYDPATASFESLLTKYRFSQEDVDLFNSSYQESYVFPGTQYDIAEPLLVLKTENGTVQESMQRITNIMTNVAGNSATDIDETVLSIETKQLVVDENGTITEGSGTPSVTASITDAVVTYESAGYDEITAEGLTFTELTFIYKMPDIPYHQKVFRLRILVEEPILYGVHMKILEGSVNSVAELRQNGLQGTAEGTRVVIANDSDYTLLMEYTYGKAREKMPDEVAVDKSFILKDSGGLKELPVGTKLRLIDVTHGNVPYYYTVEEEGITELKFSDFKDSAGNSYVNQPINSLPSEGEVSQEDANTKIYTDLAGHSLSNIGVERYLLTVFNAETGNVGYQIHTNMAPQILKDDGTEDVVASENAKTQFSPLEEHEQLPWFLVIAVPGLEISLVREDAEGNKLTDIDGKITKEDSLTIKATILLDGDYMYWEYMNQDGLDSENNGKYLELAFYLRDGGRVNLPEGTNVSYVTGTDGEGNNIYSDNKIIQDNTVAYYYKDILEITKLIDDLTANANKNDVTIPVEFVLNFAGGDLSEFTSGSYEACIELLRTADSEYPMGSGNTLDIYTETVQAQAANNLGFAIKSTKLEQLAINTYPAASEENQIDYQTMFDFSDILEKISGVGKEEALAKWAGFDYEVTYQLWKKTENAENVTYNRYTGDDIVIKVTDAVGEQVSSGGTVTAKYQFDADEIEDGTPVVDAERQEGLIVRDGKMLLATADLVNASQENLTNYKIIATMKIRERGAGLTGEEAETKDFFVFTVTKLKTDLSE